MEGKQQIGLNVQPEFVSTNSNVYKSINYPNPTPVLVVAIKEQQQKINQLEKENAALIKRLDRIEKLLSR
ncbi:MAG: hypothetical protein ACP5DQ_11915 [Bacteroidales bacterium]